MATLGEKLDLKLYVARQSWVSIGSDATKHLPANLASISDFQRRMVLWDFEGSARDRILAIHEDLDLLLLDLVDERHGFYRLSDGSVVTRSIDLISSNAIDLMPVAEHLVIGSQKHFDLWSEAAAAFSDWLASIGLLSRTIVLAAPWAENSHEGAPTPSSMGTSAVDANRIYETYYGKAEQHGFHLLRPSAANVAADPDHRWGFAPFHYARPMYDELVEKLNAHLQAQARPSLT